MQYPQFRRDGWPIGSGMVESANKNVVEARLKGTGMHWERKNVNPMLALRNAVCNGRWKEMWRKAVLQHRKQQAHIRSVRVEQRAQALLAVGQSTSAESPPQFADTSQISPSTSSQPIAEAETPVVTALPPMPEALPLKSSRPSTQHKSLTYRKRVNSSHQRSDVCLCGTPLMQLKGHRTRQYCSDRCRQRAHRKLQAHSKPLSAPTRSTATVPPSVHHQLGSATKRKTGANHENHSSQGSDLVSRETCICGTPLLQPSGGQSRHYCSHRCRQRAYRERQKQAS
jgi:hypothetical protein